MPLTPQEEKAYNEALDRIKRPRSGLPFPGALICKKCGAHADILGYFEFCANCRPCKLCRYRPVDGNNEVGLCSLCICKFCGGADGYDVPDAKRSSYMARVYYEVACKPCLVKHCSEVLCRNCVMYKPTTYARIENWSTDKPVLCDSCARGSGQETLCWYCHSKVARRRQMLLKVQIEEKSGRPTQIFSLVCNACSKTKTCHKGTCTPIAQCEKCKVEPHHGPQEGIFFEQPIVFYPAESRGLRRVNNTTRFVSAEIEVAGLRVNREASHNLGPCDCIGCYSTRIESVKSLIRMLGGSIVYDESIPDGFEINTPPAAGDKFVEIITKISDCLRAASAATSKRCGTHVHMDARDYSVADLRRLLVLYSRIEPALLFTQPAERTILNKRPHCYPCGPKYAVLDKIDFSGIPKSKGAWPKALRHTMTEVIYEKQFERLPRLARGNNRSIRNRYDALNVHSYFYRGTLECRLHAGTLSAKKIIKWGSVWASIMDYALTLTDADIQSLPREITHEGAKQMLLDIVPRDTHEYLINRWGLYEKDYKGRKWDKAKTLDEETGEPTFAEPQ